MTGVPATTYFLELGIGEHYPSIQRYGFTDYDSAMAQLNAIEPMMGHGTFRNDPEKARHRIKSDDGEAVVLVGHVHSARVIDRAKFDALASYSKHQEHGERVDLAREIVKASRAFLEVPPADE